MPPPVPLNDDVNLDLEMLDILEGTRTPSPTGGRSLSTASTVTNGGSKGGSVDAMEVEGQSGSDNTTDGTKKPAGPEVETMDLDSSSNEDEDAIFGFGSSTSSRRDGETMKVRRKSKNVTLKKPMKAKAGKKISWKLPQFRQATPSDDGNSTDDLLMDDDPDKAGEEQTSRV